MSRLDLTACLSTMDDAPGRGAPERIRDNILCAVIALLAMGLVSAYSVSASLASDLRVGYLSLAGHAARVALALGAMFLLSRLDYRLLQRGRWPLFLAALFLLALVLVPGVGALRNGARRWFRIGGFSFQPSEFARFALLILLAGHAAEHGEDLGRFFRGFLPAVVAIGLTSGLVLAEPDFGTAGLLGAVGILLVVVAGARLWHVWLVSLPGAAALAYLVLRSPTRFTRVLAFLDPWAHYDGPGYQVIQSLVALGSGGYLGAGPGGSVQKLYFLPEPGSDFVLSVIGEEMGLVGCLGVLVLFALLVVEGMRLSGRARDPFGSLIAFGITCTIGLQALINVAVVTASMPTKGIALPFISAGGSSLLFNAAAVGVLLNIARQAAEPDRGAVAPLDAEGELTP